MGRRRCCCDSGCPHCTGPLPDQVQLTFSGISDAVGSGCSGLAASLNATFVLDYTFIPSNPCSYLYEFDEGTSACDRLSIYFGYKDAASTFFPFGAISLNWYDEDGIERNAQFWGYTSTPPAVCADWSAEVFDWYGLGTDFFGLDLSGASVSITAL